MKVKDITLDMNNPIVKAVEPLKADAIKRAEEEANKIIQRVTDLLHQAGNDIQIAAPYPKSVGPNALWGEHYHMALSKYKLFKSLTKSRKGSRSPNEPDFADIDQNLVQRFIKQSKEDAAFQYKQFIHKLVRKIGKVKDAVLEGNHVWGYSILTVTLPDDTKQKWKTQQIVNVSKLGKLFNQWPTRKVK
jgi:hypothetical protein